MGLNKEMEAKVDDFIGDVQPPIVAEPPIVEPPVVVVPPVVEPSVVPPVLEPPSEVPPVVEPPLLEPLAPAPIVPPVVTPPVDPVHPKDPREVEMEQMRETILELRKLVENAAAQVSIPQSPVAPPIVPPTVKFVEKEEDLDKILSSVDNFNAFMNTVLSKVSEQVPKNTLDVGMIDNIVMQKLAVNEFYANNRDLTSNKAYVGLVANEMSLKNPTWTLEDIIKNLATEVRTRLGMSGIAPPPVIPGIPPTTPTTPDPPAFVPGGGTRPSSGGASLSRIEAGIADLIDGVNI